MDQVKIGKFIASCRKEQGMFCAMKIEREVGYYKCSNCGHVYVPTRRQHWMARHRYRDRYMVCPSCGKKCWAEKVVTKG